MCIYYIPNTMKSCSDADRWSVSQEQPLEILEQFESRNIHLLGYTTNNISSIAEHAYAVVHQLHVTGTS